ncbi:hypothetical protein [Thioalkalivibrio sp. ALMg13-2]|nr:hypothetical protein [Thioalkalivibrio sp. ALMg13-2]
MGGHEGLEPMDAPDTPRHPRIEAILPESDTAALDALARTLDAARTPNP